MNKEAYIQSGLLKLNQSFLSALLLFGAFADLSLSILDYLVTPENFTTFLLYRIAAAAITLGLYFLLRLRPSWNVQLVIVVSATFVTALMIELMIFTLGAHQSTYYAGMIILLALVLGFLPISLNLASIVASIVYATYFVPILLFDTISDTKSFINNNVFLIAAAFCALLWRYYNQKILLNKLSLEYDLSQEKEKLENYSHHLEVLVQERTKELTISEEKYRALFDNANEGVAVLDRNGTIVDVNQRFCELHNFGKDVLLGTNVRLLEADEDEHKKKERLATIINGEALVFETRHYRRDGDKILLEVSSRSIELAGELYIQSFYRDITEKKRLQEQLFQSQKMESIGVLAGGIAHDFNNILSAILGHAELLTEFSDIDETSKHRVRIIETSARKAGQMISKLLSFARKGSFESVPIDLNDVLRDSLALLERMMHKKNVYLKIEADDTIPSISGDSNQLEQVLMNLIVNAGDAMPNGGFVTVSTSVKTLGNDAYMVHPLLTPGKYVVLKVADTGAGIPEEIKHKIFDPFFTTKTTGKGTGLGLAMVYGIVKEHKGLINMRTQLGQGTTFEIYFPATDKVIHKRTVKPLSDAVQGRENILVIDDEEEVLSFVKDVLESQGYRVMALSNAVYALDIFKEVKGNFDLIITDIVMPLINGAELVKQFRMIRPDVKIIAVSGYAAGTFDPKDRQIEAFLNKPFEGTYLLSVVRRVLDSGARIRL